MDWTLLQNTTPPAIFGIFPIYGITALIGCLAIVGWTYVEWNKKGYRTWDFLFLVSWSTIFIIYGAKIWYMIFDPVNAFGSVGGGDPLLDIVTIIFVPAFGRSIMGSIVFAPIGVWIWQKRWGGEYETLEMIDMMLPSFFIGQAIGRWGNFANQTIYGDVVTMEQISWLPTFIIERMNIDGDYREPLFLYESFADVIGLLFIYIAFRQYDEYWNDGSAAFAYMITYSFIRMIMEPMRDEAFKMWWGPINTTEVMSILMFITASTLLIINQWVYPFKKEQKST